MVDLHLVGMAQLLLLLVVLCQDSSAAVFQDNSARMSPDKFPGKSAKLFLNKNARVFQERHAEMFQDKYRGRSAKISTMKNVPLFQKSNARLFPGSSVLMFLDKNVRMFHDKSAEVFPAKIAATSHDRCQGRSVNLFQLRPAVSTLSRSVPISPSKCASVYLTNSARRCQDKCAQQLSQHMANNTSLTQLGYGRRIK